MSNLKHEEPECVAQTGKTVLSIKGKETDLGGFSVRRVLPSAERKMVGPFIFFDHMGPAEFTEGEGIQVRPHPHIGLATITYLFDGEIEHRDSIGSVQRIRPGALNLMTAGKGIVHSERAVFDTDKPHRAHALQLWIALPDDAEECAPAFDHYAPEELPAFDLPGASGRVLIGSAFGVGAPVKTRSAMLYAEVTLEQDAALELPGDVAEIAVYVIAGELDCDGIAIAQHTMAILNTDDLPTLRAITACQFAIIGGDPVGERHIAWNFVSSNSDRIDQAMRDWQEQRFPGVPGDSEFTPLPDRFARRIGAKKNG